MLKQGSHPGGGIFEFVKKKEDLRHRGTKKKLHMFEFAVANFYTENHSAPPFF
jgi:hypothetical protein